MCFTFGTGFCGEGGYLKKCFYYAFRELKFRSSCSASAALDASACASSSTSHSAPPPPPPPTDWWSETVKLPGYVCVLGWTEKTWLVFRPPKNSWITIICPRIKCWKNIKEKKRRTRRSEERANDNRFGRRNFLLIGLRALMHLNFGYC